MPSESPNNGPEPDSAKRQRLEGLRSAAGYEAHRETPDASGVRIPSQAHLAPPRPYHGGELLRSSFGSSAPVASEYTPVVQDRHGTGGTSGSPSQPQRSSQSTQQGARGTSGSHPQPQQSSQSTQQGAGGTSGSHSQPEQGEQLVQGSSGTMVRNPTGRSDPRLQLSDPRSTVAQLHTLFPGYFKPPDI